MTERAKLAQDFHDQGYNCAQAVACAYCDLVGLDKETASKMSEGGGFGRGGMEMCRSGPAESRGTYRAHATPE